MNSLKSLFVMVVLAAVAYGVYVSINRSPLSPSTAQNAPTWTGGVPQVQLPTTPSAAPPFGTGPLPGAPGIGPSPMAPPGGPVAVSIPGPGGGAMPSSPPDDRGSPAGPSPSGDASGLAVRSAHRFVAGSWPSSRAGRVGRGPWRSALLPSGRPGQIGSRPTGGRPSGSEPALRATRLAAGNDPPDRRTARSDCRHGDLLASASAGVGLQGPAGREPPADR